MLRKEAIWDYGWKMHYEAYWDAAIDRLAVAAEQKARTEEVSRLNITLVETDSPRQDSLRTAGSKLNRNSRDENRLIVLARQHGIKMANDSDAIEKFVCRLPSPCRRERVGRRNHSKLTASPQQRLAGSPRCGSGL